MADLSIRKDFVDGVQDLFKTLFNDGETDGINLYLLSDKTKTNVYGESKYKVYKEPKMLVAQARLTPTQGEQDVEGVKDNAVFVVPLKSLQERELGVTNADLDILRQGVIEFHGVFYTIENILPKAYITDVFLMYQFICTEDKYTTSVLVEEPEIEEPEVGEDIPPEVEIPEEVQEETKEEIGGETNE